MAQKVPTPKGIGPDRRVVLYEAARHRYIHHQDLLKVFETQDGVILEMQSPDYQYWPNLQRIQEGRAAVVRVQRGIVTVEMREVL